MACFENVSIDYGIAQQAVGGPMFQTIVVATGSGDEQRVGLWADARGKWDLSGALKKPDQRDALIAFFRARRGRLHGFRFRDYTDDSLTLQPTIALDALNFQIYKHYTSGSVTIDRKITKPIAATIAVFDGTTPVPSGWTLDDTTGILTFAVAPGYLPNVSGNFEVPCRFDTDSFAFKQEAPGYGSWDQVPIVELRGE